MSKRRLPVKFKTNPNLEEVVLRAKVEHLFLETGSIEKTAKQLNLSVSFTKNLLKKSNFAWKDAIKLIRNKGYSLSELAKFFTVVKSTPSPVRQRLLLKLSKELPEKIKPLYSWLENYSETIDEALLNKGYKKSELAHLIQNSFNFKNFRTAYNIIIQNISPPDYQIQEKVLAKIKDLPKKNKRGINRKNPNLEEESLRAKIKHIFFKTGSAKEVARQLNLHPKFVKKMLNQVDLPNLQWKKTVDSLTKKGYSKAEIARLLVGEKWHKAINWLNKKNSPHSLELQKKIIDLKKSLPSKRKRNLNWQSALKELFQKGYSGYELAKLLEQKGFNFFTARGWMARKRMPPREAQKIIIELNRTSESKSSYQKEWQSALQELYTKGYRPTELAKVLKENNYISNLSTAYAWFADKVRHPPLEVRKFIVSLNTKLKPKGTIDWQSALQELFKKGYGPMELAKMLEEKSNYQFEKIYPWFYRRSIPVREKEAQKFVVKLNERLQVKKKRNLEEEILKAKIKYLFVSENQSVADISSKLNVTPDYIKKVIKQIK